MEAAASLFGAEGPASDPFSTLGDDSANDTSKDTGGAAASAGDLFGAESAAGGDFFDQIASGNDGGNAQEGASAVGNEPAGYAMSAAAQTPQANGTSATYGQQGHYDAQHQWQPGGQQHPSITSSQMKNDPYAPPASAFQSPAAPQYNSYTPSVGTTASPYATYSGSTASPYANQNATASPYTPYATYSGATSPYITPAAETPAPPPSQPPVRPKLANAYDPPIPAVSKRKSTTQLAPAASAYGAYPSPAMYGSFQQQQQQPVQPAPPPPRKVSTPSAPPRPPSTSRFASPPPPRPTSSNHVVGLPPPSRPTSTSQYSGLPPSTSSPYAPPSSASYAPPTAAAHPPPPRSPSVPSQYASPPPPRPSSQNWNQPSSYAPTAGSYAPSAPAESSPSEPKGPSSEYKPSASTDPYAHTLGSAAHAAVPSQEAEASATALDAALDPEGGGYSYGHDEADDPEGGQHFNDVEGGDDPEAAVSPVHAGADAHATSPTSVPLPPSSAGTPPLDKVASRYTVPAYPEFAYPSPPTSTISPPPTRPSAGPPPPKSNRSSPSGSPRSSVDLTQRYGSPSVPERASSRGSLRPASRTASPSANSVITHTTARSPYEPYAPASAQAASPYDPYSPQASSVNPPASTAPPAPAAFDPYAPPPNGAAPARPTISQYAPSPSLLGTNDVLGRTASRAPVISFGFGGKLVSCFHGGDSLNTGFDVALAARNQTGVRVQTLTKLLPESALDFPTSVFPGPLIGDPGATTATSLVKTSASVAKAKKTAVLKYLTDRIEELARGIAYLHSESVEGRRAEGKLVLLKLLKVMVEHDGKLTGVPQHESAIRAALLPHMYPADASGEPSPSAYSFTTPADAAAHSFTVPGISTDSSSEAPLSVVSLRKSTLDKIQDFLRKGERRAAYNLALDEKLWAHAMVIASSLDKEAWQEVVNEFLKGELGVKGSDDLSAKPAVSNGYESLRVAYRLYSGQGPASVQEMVPPNLLAQAAVTGLPPPSNGATPMAPNFSLPAGSSHICEEALAKWADTLAMMYSSNMSPDVSAAITAFGDQLQLNGWVEAAHACYLLSPLTSPIGGLTVPGARIVLLGSRGPQALPNFDKDPDAVVFSEIGEFAMSLATPIKGQEPFRGFPHMQAYRLLRAATLAELGEVQLAQRYCEAISSMLAQPSPFYTRTMLEQLKELSDRLAGCTEGDKSASWIGGKISKPSLASVGGFLEKRLTALVAGADGDGESEPEPKKSEAFSGPFALYGTLSSTEPSPNPSVTNLNEGMNGYGPPGRSSSAAEVRRTAPPPLNRTASASVSYGAPYGHSPNPYAASALSPIQDEPSPQTDKGDQQDQGQEVTWWGAGSYSNTEQSSQTPKASNFVHLNEGLQVPQTDGFISLMDNAPTPFSAPPSSMSFRNTDPPRNNAYDEEDMEDLGFGNSKKERRSEEVERKPEPEKPAERPDPKPVQQSSSGGSSRSSWWPFSWRKSSEGQGQGPIKANLGEEAGGNDSKPAAPPPPPPRAQTASPGMMMNHNPRMTAAPPLSGTRPPARAASVADMASGPPPGKTIPRVRSNLVPTPEGPPTPGSPLPGSSSSSSMLAPPGTPPPGRPRSSASKRPARSRYVDVFNQPGQ
uniref:Protein transport protein sec16 n=1 Tax=Schizophyllum commune (strain H4-8 / FGSC 9210) TaxID=578458 RepID=D8PSY6_SCHCM